MAAGHPAQIFVQRPSGLYLDQSNASSGWSFFIDFRTNSRRSYDFAFVPLSALWGNSHSVIYICESSDRTWSPLSYVTSNEVNSKLSTPSNKVAGS